MKNRAAYIGLALLAVMAIGCGAGEDDAVGPGAQPQTNEKPKQASKTKTILLEVGGNAGTAQNITYGLNGDSSQDNGAKLPWKKTLTSGESMTLVNVMAQNASDGKITCKITINGKVVKQNASNGEYAIVDCSATDVS